MLQIIPRLLFLILSLALGQQSLAHAAYIKEASIKYIADDDMQTPDNMNDDDQELDMRDPAQVVINT